MCLIRIIIGNIGDIGQSDKLWPLQTEAIKVEVSQIFPSPAALQFFSYKEAEDQDEDQTNLVPSVGKRESVRVCVYECVSVRVCLRESERETGREEKIHKQRILEGWQTSGPDPLTPKSPLENKKSSNSLIFRFKNIPTNAGELKFFGQSSVV